MINSTYSVFQRVREVLRSLDVPQSQVVIEATIAEVNLTDNLEKGVQWYLQSQNLTARASTAPTAVDPAKTGGFAHGSFTVGNVNGCNTKLNGYDPLNGTSVPVKRIGCTKNTLTLQTELTDSPILIQATGA